jgi:AcrR family transcriptional regulator
VATTRDERREQILAATWKLISRRGLRAANMRAIAAEVGYANGALAYYFDGKDDLVRAAYEYVLKQTITRIRQATTGLQGLAALRAFSAEVLPSDKGKLLEARIVIPFWESAMHERKFGKLFKGGMDVWRAEIGEHLRQAAQRGEIARQSTRARAIAVEQLLSSLMGAQVLGLLSAERHTAAMQAHIIEHFFASLR